MQSILGNLTGSAGLAFVAVASVATLLDGILSFAALVVVPLGLSLIHGRRSGREKAARLAAAALLAVGVLLPGGAWPAMMALPWLVVTLTLLATALRRDRLSALNRNALTKLAAHIFLIIGGGWAVLACGHWTVLGFEPVIVELTAIHFHYAGFALVILALKAAEIFPGRVANVSLLLVLFGVPAVAAGIAARSADAQAAATLILTAGSVLVAGLQLRAAFASRRPIVRTLLAVSAVSLLSGMALAVLYAVGQRMNRDWIDIPTMLATHGATNAFGFAFCGLLAYCLAADRETNDTSRTTS